MILQDNIAHHPKFLMAGRLIGGPAGASRALALWIAAIGYARSGLTDGLVHDAFLDKFPTDSEPKRVAKALSSPRVRLFHRVRDGYKIHDFHHYNGSADKLRQQRELARDRKRRQRAKAAAAEAVENLWKTGPARKIADGVTRDRGRDKGRDSRARDLETETEYVRTAATQHPGTSIVRSASPPIVVPLEQRPGGRHRSRKQKISEKQKHTLARLPATDGNFAVVEKLAHTVLDDLHPVDPEAANVVETLKATCAALKIDYSTDPQLVRRALASAAKTHNGQRPLGSLVDTVRASLETHTLPQTLRSLAGARRR